MGESFKSCQCAYQQGKETCRKPKGVLNDNPYVPGTDSWIWWNRGYRSQFDNLVEKTSLEA